MREGIAIQFVFSHITLLLLCVFVFDITSCSIGLLPLILQLLVATSIITDVGPIIRSETLLRDQAQEIVDNNENYFKVKKSCAVNTNINNNLRQLLKQQAILICL